MATGKSSTKDSDSYYEFSCSLCAAKDKNMEAVKRCEDCEENLCGECLANHSLFKKMKEHTLVDPQEIGQTKPIARPNIPSVKCKHHPGNKIELYCGNHDVVGCSTCINLSHRLCKDMHYIPDMATGITNTFEPKAVEDSIDTLIIATKRFKLDIENDLEGITKGRDKAVQQINEKIHAIKKRLDDLKEKALAEVDKSFEEPKKTIITHVKKSADMITKLEDEKKQLTAKRLNAAQQGNEADLFIHMKQGKAERRESNTRMREIERSAVKPTIRVCVDDTVLASATELDTFATIQSETPIRFMGFLTPSHYFTECNLKTRGITGQRTSVRPKRL